MKFAVIGGDRRAVLLCSLLAEDGHRVRTYCLERAELSRDTPKAGCLQGCVYGADWVIVGIPAETGGVFNAPFAAQELKLGELIGALWPGQVLCGGKFSQEASLSALHAGLAVADLMQRRDFTVGNAAITAEGAIEQLMKNSEKTLLGSHVLITGWGRIASVLAPRLRALGAYVTVCARKAGDRAMAQAQGLGCCSFEEIALLAEDVDFLVNTVPAEVLDRRILGGFRKDTVLLELASAPGGFDAETAAELELNTVSAPGLPGKYAPFSAAELMRDTIYAIIREREDQDGR